MPKRKHVNKVHMAPRTDANQGVREHIERVRKQNEYIARKIEEYRQKQEEMRRMIEEQQQSILHYPILVHSYQGISNNL